LLYRAVLYVMDIRASKRDDYVALYLVALTACEIIIMDVNLCVGDCGCGRDVCCENVSRPWWREVRAISSEQLSTTIGSDVGSCRVNGRR